jgi:hypothetical protein
MVRWASGGLSRCLYHPHFFMQTDPIPISMLCGSVSSRRQHAHIPVRLPYAIAAASGSAAALTDLLLLIRRAGLAADYDGIDRT